MRFCMNYKKIVVLCSVAIIASATVFSACSKKKNEEDITITLKTEGAVPAQPPAGQTPRLEEQQAKEKPNPVPGKRENVKEVRRERVVSLPQRKVSRNKTEPIQQQVASATPQPPPQPSPEAVARELIRSIINRQKQAMITKNVPLALQDIAGNNEQNKRALEDYFNRYEKIDVNFSNISINVSGSSATAVMDQRTSIVTKSLIPQTITELTRVQWTFIEEDNRWLISGTQILSKMKDK